MFQSYEDRRDPAAGAGRVARLRQELDHLGLDGFVVPRADEHQGEYVPACAERLAWLTGFSGSAGVAIVLASRAAIFVDGRYTEQVRGEVDVTVFEICHLVDQPPSRWIERVLEPGMRLGYDPWLHTIEQTERLQRACCRAGAELTPLRDNPIDRLWQDRPPPPTGRVRIHEIQHAGEPAERKLARLGEDIRRAGADAVVLTLPDSIAWAFNIRGSDIPHIPVVLAFAVVRADAGAELFVAPEKLDDEVRDRLRPLAELRPPEDFESALEALGEAGARVLVDAAWTPRRVADVLEGTGATLVRGSDPCQLPKARKNSTEIAGARNAHLRDGAAVTRFLAWLDRQPVESLDEIAAARALEEFRVATGKLMDISFPSISAFGPNGALPHYRVTETSNRRFASGSLYLIDSGGQYLDGTTDITRTVAIGTPSEEMRDRFTRVLKGNIAISRVRFPNGTTGAQLDTLARIALWEAGLDFDHGTGHGVGSYLSVHEGPQRLSRLGTTPLEPGMILSNEPGYYKAGAYGIRIENLVLVRADERRAGEERDMLRFEVLTLAPIDSRLVAPELLTDDERAWLDDYHERVRRELSPLLSSAESEWLAQATRPLSP